MSIERVITWRPVAEVLPVRFERVLISLSSGNVVIGYRFDGTVWDWEAEDEEDEEAQPTHWALLPLPVVV